MIRMDWRIHNSPINDRGRNNTKAAELKINSYRVSEPCSHFIKLGLFGILMSNKKIIISTLIQKRGSTFI